MSAQDRKQYHYIDGNTVRKTAPAPGRITVSTNPNIYRKNRDKARYMNLGYVAFLVAALLTVALALTAYLGLQSDITNTSRNIAVLERELNSLRLSNDENHSRIINNVDLEYIRRVAITELGMIYAQEGQITVFADNRDDYVRQLNAIP